MKIFELNRNVTNEAHHYKGFLRFRETEDGILIGKLSPKNDIIRLLAPHFSDRLSLENFVIYDEGRDCAVIHPKSTQWFFTDTKLLNIEEYSNVTEKEQSVTDMWKAFFTSVSIKERENKDLQKNNLPFHFRSSMTEFEFQE